MTLCPWCRKDVPVLDGESIHSCYDAYAVLEERMAGMLTRPEALRFAAEWLTGNLHLHEISGWRARCALRAEAKRMEKENEE